MQFYFLYVSCSQNSLAYTSVLQTRLKETQKSLYCDFPLSFKNLEFISKCILNTR